MLSPYVRDPVSPPAHPHQSSCSEQGNPCRRLGNRRLVIVTAMARHGSGEWWCRSQLTRRPTSSAALADRFGQSDPAGQSGHLL